MRIHIDPSKVNAFMASMNQRRQNEELKFPVDIDKKVPEMMQVFAMRPDIAQVMIPLSQTVYMNGRIERPLKEKLFVRVSKLNQCQFCTATHSKALESLNLEEQGDTEREQVAIEYAEHVTGDANSVRDDLFQRLKQHFDEGEIIELTLAIGLINMLNMFNNALQIHYEE